MLLIQRNLHGIINGIFDEETIKQVKVDNAANADTVNGKTVESNVPANAKFTDTIYTHPSSHPASMITESTTKRFVTDVEKVIGITKQKLMIYPLIQAELTNDSNFVVDASYVHN